MEKLLKSDGVISIANTGAAWRDITREIKDKTCFVSLDYSNDLEISKNREMIMKYELPDTSVI